VFPIIEALQVDLLFDSGQTYGGCAYRDCIASAHSHHVPIVIAKREKLIHKRPKTSRFGKQRDLSAGLIRFMGQNSSSRRQCTV
jgi:hypothetical protein